MGVDYYKCNLCDEKSLTMSDGNFVNGCCNSWFCFDCLSDHDEIAQDPTMTCKTCILILYHRDKKKRQRKEKLVDYLKSIELSTEQIYIISDLYY